VVEKSSLIVVALGLERREIVDQFIRMGACELASTG